jgi:hypothetical protein
MKRTEGGISVNLCSSVDRLSTDFTDAHRSGSRKRAEGEGGQRVMGPGTAQVEHVPLETYDFTSPGKTANASQHMSCRLFERGKF